MKFLLDTSVWIWMVEPPEALPAATRKLLGDFRNAPFGLSCISVWEVAKKVSLGKLSLSLPIRDWITAATRPPFIEVLPLLPDISIESTQLPGTFHNDPADQIIVATARIHKMPLITSDEKILGYAHVKTLWA